MISFIYAILLISHDHGHIQALLVKPNMQWSSPLPFNIGLSLCYDHLKKVLERGLAKEPCAAGTMNVSGQVLQFLHTDVLPSDGWQPAGTCFRENQKSCSRDHGTESLDQHSSGADGPHFTFSVNDLGGRTLVLLVNRPSLLAWKPGE